MCSCARGTCELRSGAVVVVVVVVVVVASAAVIGDNVVSYELICTIWSTVTNQGLKPLDGVEQHLSNKLAQPFCINTHLTRRN